MPDNTKDTETSKPGERLAKRIARAGVCSRRDAEVLIAEGRVMVNGKLVKTPAYNVLPNDHVKVNNKLIEATEPTRLWLYHKPAGLMTTHKDPQGRPTVFERLPKGMPRVISVGRLDFNSEGLLLLTNDGELARKLEHPSTGWKRRYRVRVFGDINNDMQDKIRAGITVEGISYRPADIELDREKGDNSWITITLKEGKNREIRRIFDHFGCKVSRLMRTAYGPFQLGALPRGEAKEVTGKVIKSFIKF